MKYQTQARNERKYFDQSYLSARRWSSYAIQIREAMLAKPKKILEIGPGNNIVTENLKKLGYEVKTLDIDNRLGVDYIGSVTDKILLKELEGKFDLIIACEIFEHIKYSDFKEVLGLLKEVAPKMIVSLPHTELNSRFIHFALKFPLIKEFSFSTKIFYKKTKYEFNGEHYWEMGTVGHSIKKISHDIVETGWQIKKRFFNPDNPYHYFLILEGKSYEN